MNVTQAFARHIGRQSFRTALFVRPLSISATYRKEKEEGKIHSNADGYRDDQKYKASNPHMTNTASTFHEDMP